MRFDLNPNLEAELAALPGYKAEAVATANAIKDRASLAAPVLTQNYRRTMRVVATPDGAAAATRDVAGHILEWGSINSPAHAPLRGAVRSLGLRFVATPKA